MNNEIVLYRPNELAEHIEVRFKEDTVWLSQEQLTQLFNRDQSVISRHIRNVFKEGELDEKSNMQKMHIPNSDKPVAFFNLDVIISVGYRVKSKQGTQFRIWATNVLRDYLLKGYALNQRMDRIENNYETLALDVKKANEQVGNFELHELQSSHDRFLIIDRHELYHLGASLKDLGKKWFAFSKLEGMTETVVDNLFKINCNE